MNVTNTHIKLFYFEIIIIVIILLTSYTVQSACIGDRCFKFTEATVCSDNYLFTVWKTFEHLQTDKDSAFDSSEASFYLWTS